MLVQSNWPTPARIVHRRRVSIPFHTVKNAASLDLSLQFRDQRQFISVGPNPPDDAKIVETLKLVAFDLNTIFKRPVIDADASGEFFARFKQMNDMRLDLTSD